VNKVLLAGRLTRDPEMRALASGKHVTQFSVATTEYAGNGKERPEFHNVVTWDRLAEVCGRYLGKGQQVALEGRLQTRTWDDDKGARHWKTEIVATTVSCLVSPRSALQIFAQDDAELLPDLDRPIRERRGIGVKSSHVDRIAILQLAALELGVECPQALERSPQCIVEHPLGQEHESSACIERFVTQTFGQLVERPAHFHSPAIRQVNPDRCADERVEALLEIEQRVALDPVAFDHPIARALGRV
jgi:hypothetical protein